MRSGQVVTEPLAEAIPSLPGGHLPRPRLLALMDGALTTPLTVVAAPAGSGKTVVVSEWADRLLTRAGLPPVLEPIDPPADPPAMAWVSCERWEEPDDFWRHVQAALVASAPALASHHNVLPVQAGPLSTHSASRRVRSLLTHPAASRSVILVLDDFHLVNQPSIMRQLDDLLPRLAPTVHVVVVSRSDPALSVERLRVAGAQLQVRAADLSFTSAETRQLIAAAGVHIDENAVGLLMARTEGWAAGIRLALLSMQGRDEPAEVVEQLVRDDSPVAAYLVEQVLGRLEPTVRQFVLDTSVVERFSPELAAVVSGRDDADALLRELVGSHTFLVRLDAPTPSYRYHALFGALLQHRLSAETSDEHRRRLHQRAARQLEAEGKGTHAVRHALEAADWSVAAQMLIRLAVRALPRGQHRVVAELLSRFPQQCQADDQRLRWLAAVTSLVRGDDEAAAAMLATGPAAPSPADGADARRLAVMWAIAHAGLARARGRHDEALSALPTALPDLPRADDADYEAVDASLSSEWVCARAGALLWSGRIDEAADAATLALPLARSGGNDWNMLDAWGALALVDVVRGRLTSGQRTAEQAVEFARQRMWLDLPQMVSLYMADCYVRLSRADIAGARSAYARCEQAWHWLPNRPASKALRLLKAWIDLCATGNGRQALVETQQPEQQGASPSWLERRLTVMVRAECLLSLGEVDECVRVTAAGRPDDFGPGHHVLMAWLEARQLLYHSDGHSDDERSAMLRRVEATARSLEAVDADMVTDNCVRLRLLLTCALLAVRRGDNTRSSHLLELVLDDVEHDGWRLPLLELGDGTRELLRAQYGQVTRHGRLISELLAALVVDGGAAQLVAPLSERETEVLLYLPTGLSQAELCATLFISHNTLKSHLRSIYRKLGVASRRDAVIHARDIDLL